MKKTRKRINSLLQILLPLLFFLYLYAYKDFQEALQRANLSTAGVFDYVGLYFLLVLVFLYMAVSSCKDGCSLVFLILGWAESLALCILPLTFVLRNDAFMRIKEYPIDYLYLYGMVVVLYSALLVYFCCLRCRKEKE